LLKRFDLVRKLDPCALVGFLERFDLLPQINNCFTGIVVRKR
jgi:hypothetical protein